MKRRLLFSIAVLFGTVMMFAEKPVDLSSKYLQNYLQPYTYLNKFTATGDTVVEQLPEDAIRPLNETGAPAVVSVTVAGQAYDFYRFRKLAGPWIVENSSTQDDGGQTGWHVDLQKGKTAKIRGALTLTVGWDGFADSISNAKVFQTVTLPAGRYTLNAYYGQDLGGAKYSFLVANVGTSIPDTLNLSTALAYKKIAGLSTTAPVTIEFELAAETQVSLGVVSSFPAGSGACLALGDIKLGGFVAGTDYTALKSAVTSANNMTAAQYPTGTTAGKYPVEMWNAFVTARAEADSIVRHENLSDPTAPGFTDNHTQAEVDAALAALNTAITNLNASFIIPFKVSTSTGEYWYRLHDRRSPQLYWTVGEALLGDAYVTRLLVTNKENMDADPMQDNYLFKFVKNPNGQGFYIYNKSFPDNALSVDAATANFVKIDPTAKDTTWMVKTAIGNYPEYFRIYLRSNTAKQLNSFAYEGSIVGFWNATGEDPGNDWNFVRYYPAGATDFTALRNQMGAVGTVTEASFPIGTGPGQFPQSSWDAFVAAKAAAQAILDREDTANQPTQTEVDDATSNLKTALEQLIASMIPPIQFSTATSDVWYKVHDKRAANNYWKYDVLGGRLVLQAAATADLQNDTTLHFRFIRPANAVANEFLIYPRVKMIDNNGNIIPSFAITNVADDKNLLFAGFEEASDTLTFVTAKTPAFDADYFLVHLQRDKKMQFNSYVSQGFVGFYNPGSVDDAGNDWKFVPVTATGVKNVTMNELGVYVQGRRILARDPNAVLNVYSVSGQKVNVAYDLTPGVYIVTVKGKSGAGKLIVR